MNTQYKPKWNGQAIKDLIEKHNQEFGHQHSYRRMTKSSLSRKLGVSRHALYRWVDNKQVPRCEHLISLCIVFNAKPNDFFMWEKNYVKSS